MSEVKKGYSDMNDGSGSCARTDKSYPSGGKVLDITNPAPKPGPDEGISQMREDAEAMQL